MVDEVKRGRPPVLSDDRLPAVRAAYEADATIAEIAEREGVGVGTVYRFFARHGIERRRSGPRRGHASGGCGAGTTLRPEDRAAIERALREDDPKKRRSQAQLARAYGVSRQWINQIARELRKDE